MLAPSPRETIRSLLASGVRNKEIAHRLGVSRATVSLHGLGIERPRYVPAVKHCTVCGKAFGPARTGGPGRWARRIACSRECGGTFAWSRS